MRKLETLNNKLNIEIKKYLKITENPVILRNQKDFDLIENIENKINDLICKIDNY